MRQDPNARNCHGYRKFVKRSVLENLNNGYLVNDTIVIRYTIELVVSTGGALTRQPGSNAPKLPLIQVLNYSLPLLHAFTLICSAFGAQLAPCLGAALSMAVLHAPVIFCSAIWISYG